MEPNSHIDSNRSAGSALPQWAGPLFIVIATFIAYMPALSAGYIWDDDFHVFKNPHLLDLDGLIRIWFTTESQQYYPLVYSSFWLEQHLWGFNPAGYHAVNIALHAINSLLVLALFRRLAVPGGVIVALVFALHPVHVESVAWITERKNLLSGLFFLASMLLYLESEDDDNASRYYALSLASFILALFSKTVACSLPPILIVMRWMRGLPIGLREVKRLLPFFIVGFILGLVTVFWEVKFVGASGEEWKIGITERLLLPGRVFWFYIGKLLWPAELIFIYPRWTLDAGSLIQWLYPASAIILLAVTLALWKRIGRPVFAALLCFLLALFPALGFFNVYPFRYSFVADHFQYLASIAVIGLVTGIIAAAAGKKRAFPAALSVIIFLVVAAALGTLTFRQTHAYKDYEILWRDTLEKNPSAWIAHNNLGNVLLERGETNGAMEHFQTSIDLNPNDPVAYYNLANIFSKEGFLKEAESYYLLAIDIKEDYAAAHFNLANVLFKEKIFTEALHHYERAVEIDPDDPDYRINLGNTLYRLGKTNGAREQWGEALRINPQNETARRNLRLVSNDRGGR